VHLCLIRDIVSRCFAKIVFTPGAKAAKAATPSRPGSRLGGQISAAAGTSD
jgi:hypothetical protein